MPCPTIILNKSSPSGNFIIFLFFLNKTTSLNSSVEDFPLISILIDLDNLSISILFSLSNIKEKLIISS